MISTGDKDLAQLVDEHVTLVNTMDNTKLDRAGVQAKFGVTPEQIADYLALIGDPIDNIPGIEGVGPKTAAKWLQQYPTSTTLKANAAQIPGKIGDRLRAALDTLDLSKELATIRCDVELPLHIADLALSGPDVERLAGLFERLEFGRLLRRLRGEPGRARAARRQRRRARKPGSPRRALRRRGSKGNTRRSSRTQSSAAGSTRSRPRRSPRSRSRPRASRIRRPSS